MPNEQELPWLTWAISQKKLIFCSKFSNCENYITKIVDYVFYVYVELLRFKVWQNRYIRGCLTSNNTYVIHQRIDPEEHLLN